IGFLGFGLQFPATSWGDMLGGAQNYVTEGYWWLVYPVGGCLVLLVLATNLVGDALRDAFDVRLRRRWPGAQPCLLRSRWITSRLISSCRGSPCRRSATSASASTPTRRSGWSASRVAASRCSASRSSACCPTAVTSSRARSSSAAANSSGCRKPRCGDCEGT